jgi:Uma2 family endonuclease
MTWDEYLEWVSDENDAEWVDGEIVWMSPVSTYSGDLTQFLAALLRLYAEHHDLGDVFVERALMRLRTRPSGREPDIFFVAKERRDTVTRTYIDGPADLVIEITAKESQRRDRVEKFAEYQRAGVREYWIIDPDKKTAEFYELDAEGGYVPVLPGSDGIYRSPVMHGIWFKVDWFWQRPLPPLLSVLREWKII